MLHLGDLAVIKQRESENRELFVKTKTAMQKFWKKDAKELAKKYSDTYRYYLFKTLRIYEPEKLKEELKVSDVMPYRKEAAVETSYGPGIHSGEYDP
jgi:hypothetical protein